MQPLVGRPQTGYWIPACAGMTDNALNPATTLPVVFVGECVISVSICNKRKFLRLHKLPGLKSPNELANRYKYAQ